MERSLSQHEIAEPDHETDMTLSLYRFHYPSLLQESAQGSQKGTAPSNVGETQPERDWHLLDREETVKSSSKSQEKEPQFLRSKVKALDKSKNSLPAIGAVLEIIQRRH